jgi:hypothetical protein
MKKYLSYFVCFFLLAFIIPVRIKAQTEVMAWGNITGIRVDGQLMEFESSIRMVNNGWTYINATGREKQQPKYHRDGQKQIVITSIDGVKFTETINDCGAGCANVVVDMRSEKDTVGEGVFFCIDLPGKFFDDARIKFSGTTPAARSNLKLSDISSVNNNQPWNVSAKGLKMTSLTREIEIIFGEKDEIYVRKASDSATQLYIRISGPEIQKGIEIHKTFNIRCSGEIDKSPAEIILDSMNPGEKFAGLGGNFRLQNPGTDPQVIDYCLKNLRVAWGRVEMPWNLWHPDENTSPLETAKSGKLNFRVQAAMKMAQRLDSLGIPFILSDWAAPNWAILGNPADAYKFRSKGIFGYQLNPEKTAKIYQSIVDYLVFLKQNYGVEPALFSFNESDLGINIRHTGKEHAEFIKGLGAHLASKGLTTKLLLGDNSDATTFDFILPAMNDPETHKYIGAVSFHSWRGCTDETLKKWAHAARQLNIPLLVAEGSTDAAAWTYPEIFSEQAFALYEINLYVRICSICQPLSILQWQLTADYSVMTGANIFGTKGALRPTRRFWNLKQLASTPVDSYSIPVSVNKENINCAAFGSTSHGTFAVHIVNNGAEREAILKGIPSYVKSFWVFVTDQTREMEKTGEVSVLNGTAELKLMPAGFITLIGR